MSKKRSRTVEQSRKVSPFWVFMAVAAVLLGGGLIYQNMRVSSAVPATAEPLPVPVLAPTGPNLPPLAAPAGAKAVFFGDSWTVGYAADPQSHGYAYLTGDQLGWDYTVKGDSGTGYINRGPNNTGNYIDRLRAFPVDPSVQVLVLQGGLNDSGAPLADFYNIGRQTVIDARGRFPNAKIVMLGPAAASLPVSAGLSQVDYQLRSVAFDEGIYYVSPLSDHWIGTDNFEQVIDLSKKNHPSTQGHAFLAEKTVAAIRALG